MKAKQARFFQRFVQVSTQSLFVKLRTITLQKCCMCIVFQNRVVELNRKKFGLCINKKLNCFKIIINLKSNS